MQNLAYYNGRITPIDEMMIPANDRGFYFGDGVYEAAMAYGRRIFALGDHLERMENSARKLRIALPQSCLLYTSRRFTYLLFDICPERVPSFL